MDEYDYEKIDKEMLNNLSYLKDKKKESKKMITVTKQDQQQMMIALKNLSKINLDIFTKHVIGKNIQTLKPYIEAIDQASKIEGYQEFKKASDALFYKYATKVKSLPGQSKVQGKILDKDIPAFNEDSAKLREQFAETITAMEKQESEYDSYLKTTDDIEGLLKIRLPADLETTVDITPIMDLIVVLGSEDKKN